MWNLVDRQDSLGIGFLMPSDNQVLCLHDDTLLIAYELGIGFSLVRGKSFHWLKTLSKDVYLQKDTNERCELYKMHGKAIEHCFSCDAVSLDPVKKDRVLAYLDSTAGNTGFSQMHDCATGELLWSREMSKAFFSSFMAGNCLFISSILEERLYRVDIDTGETLWDVTFPGDLKISHRRVEVYEGIITVVLEDKDMQSYACGLDKDNGSILWFRPTTGPLYFRHPKTGHLHSLEGRRDSGQCFFAHSVVDPYTGDTLREDDLSDQLADISTFSPYDSAITETDIYFPAIQQSSDRKRYWHVFGRIGLASGRLESLHVVEPDEIEEEITHLRDLVFHQDRLFMVVNQKQLRVYEER